MPVAIEDIKRTVVEAGQLALLYYGKVTRSLKADLSVVTEADAALESFRAALRKRPGDVVANFELGETLSAQKQPDAALFHYQKCVQAVRGMPDSAVVPPK